MNDMPQNPFFPIVQYADDTSILAPLDTEHRALQNCRHINAQKSTAMRFSCSRTADRPTYMMLGTPLAVPEFLSILGATFFPTLEFSTQVPGLDGKACRTLGLVTCASKHCGPDMLSLLYTALVLPILEYCCSVWSPSQLHLAKRVEGVQQRATRTWCSHFCSIEPHQVQHSWRLQRLGRQPLGNRQLHYRMRLLCRFLDGSLSGDHTSQRLSE